LAFESLGTEIGYGGAAGGGKSFLLRAILIYASSQIPNLRSYLFRKHFEELQQNHVDSTGGFREVLSDWIQAGLVRILQDRIEFWNGSIIYLCHCSHFSHLDKYLGPEMDILAIDQAEQFPERWIRFLRARVRMSESKKATIPEEMRAQYPRAIYTFNPGGISHSFFRKNFVKAAPFTEVWKTPPSEGGFLRQFIPALLKDNPSLNEEDYTNALMGLNDEQLIKALLHGDFDALIGNMFTQYHEGENGHLLPGFDPPEHWFKFRTFDWGSSDPFAVYWWTIADGNKFFARDRRSLWVPSGSLIGYREWYGCQPNNPSKGLGDSMSNVDIAKGILARTTEETSNITLTDSLPFQERGLSENSKKYKIADTYADHGVPLIKANTGRVYGCNQLRDRLIGINGVPLFYITEDCPYMRDYLPAVMRDETNPEAYVEHGEATHSVDNARYAATAKPITITQKPSLSDPAPKGQISIRNIVASRTQPEKRRLR
jgi:hypothetical protein